MIVVWKVIAALQRRNVRTQEAGRYKKNSLSKRRKGKKQVDRPKIS